MSIFHTSIITQLFRTALFVSILTLSACSDNNVKPSDDLDVTTDLQNSSVSSADRNKYRDGITALYNDDYDKAKSIFNDFVNTKPDLAGPYSNLSLIHYKMNKFDESMKFAEKAITLNPKQSQAYNLRALNHVRNGKIHDARKDYVKSVELKPAYINAQYNLALLYDVYLQEIELAIKHYEIYMSLLKKPDEATQDWINHLKGTLK